MLYNVVLVSAEHQSGSAIHTHTPSLSEPPSHSGHHPTLSRAPCVIQEVLTSYLSYCLVTQSCRTLCSSVTIARQASLSLGFPRQEYWGGLPFPTPEIFPTQGSNPSLLCLLHWQVDSLPLSHLGSPLIVYIHDLNSLLVPRFSNHLISFPPSL